MRVDVSRQLIEEEAAPHGDARSIVFRASGELDIATVPELRRHLEAALARGLSRLVVDLSEVSFMDSVSLATMIAVRQRLGDDGRLALVVVPESFVWLTLQAAGLLDRLDHFGTRDEATRFALA
jgi:anti-anti-sigma factor